MPRANKLPPIDLDTLKGELSRRSLKEFIRFFWPKVEPASPFVDGFHIDAICDHLAALAKREIRNLLINLPPRHCKSTLCSVIFPAWQWLHNPAEKYLYTSYSLHLAERDSVRCRRLIDNDVYKKCYGHLFKMEPDQNTKRFFQNDKTGYRLISSVMGGGTTGQGGSMIICDDPHNVAESESDIRRQNVCRWFAETFFNRLDNPATGCRLVIGQRIHNEDLSGFIIENYADQWCHLNLPYEYSPARTFTTKIGWKDPREYEDQPLWPERFPESEIAQHKKKPKYFSCQFNQNPLDTENALFKLENLRYYDELADAYRVGSKTIRKQDCYTVISADLAHATHSKADYTAIAVAHVCNTGEVVLLDMVRERLGGTKIVPKLVELNKQYHPAYIIIETSNFDQVIVDQARQEGLPVRSIKAIGDKESRSYTLQTRVESGQFWLPKERPWVAPLVKELMEFPQGAHDDMVDALSQLCNDAGKRTRARPQPTEDQSQQKVRTWDEIYREAVHQGLW